MKTICIIILATFVSVRFVSAVVDFKNKHYVVNILLALVELLALVGCSNWF